MGRLSTLLGDFNPRSTELERARRLVSDLMVRVLQRHLRAVDALCDEIIPGCSVSGCAKGLADNPSSALRAAIALVSVRRDDMRFAPGVERAIEHTFNVLWAARGAFALVGVTVSLHGLPAWIARPCSVEELQATIGTPWEVAARRAAAVVCHAAMFARDAVFAGSGGLAPEEALEGPVQRIVAAGAADVVLGVAVARLTATLADYL